MLGVYLCSREHRIPMYDIDYNDIENYEGINLLCDCRDVDISNYDYIIATPPCNYWSHANYRRESSKVALETKQLLPYCLRLCIDSGKPFIIENVLNGPLFKKELGQLYIEAKPYMFTYGGHTFWSNMFFFLPAEQDKIKQNKQYVTRSKRDNNLNVHMVIDRFLDSVRSIYE